ncbi:uncharacterized protein LOC143150533 isoform X2 [Ptiloglossa arizonensis]|uniref:uncharacterized protein LOC143150533 isoform X2 n=1 Tax=Ptiloglossa arizonensis TaxID=3350558 RepID=UPI003F9FD9A8
MEAGENSSDLDISQMEIQMENSSSISISTIINNIILYLSGNSCKNISTIKVNNDNLSTNGELYFLPSLKVWRSTLQGNNICDGKCKTILEHFLHMHNSEIDNKTDTDGAKQVLQLLISASCNWPIKIEKYCLEKERVYLFLQRVPLITNSIKAVIDLKHDFGRTLSIKKGFSLKVHQDNESELTTTRLCLIRSVTENVLNLHGCRICEEDSDFKFVFTTKSQGNVEKNYKKCVCGVVRSLESNTKETTLTWKEYIENKINDLKALNDEKNFEMHECNVQTNDYFFENVAKATATFELLSVKPSRSVIIGYNSETDRGITNIKGAPFILYNIVRIIAIVEKYNDKRLIGEYPDLPNIGDVNFSLLDQEEAYNHLIPTMVARLYMLRALQIILQNALALLNIVPVSRM